MIQFLIASLTGVLGCLSFPVYALDWCVWITLVPLLVAVAAVPISLRRAFALGWVAAVVGYCGAFPWVVPTLERFEGISFRAALALFILALAYHAAQVGLFAAVISRMRFVQHPNPYASRPSTRLRTGFTLHASRVFSVASAWVALEWLFPKVFPWSFATVLSDRLPLIQIVEVTGIWGLSFVIVAVNATLAGIIIQWRAGERITWSPVVLAAALVIGTWAFGTVRLREFGEVRAALQNSVPRTQDSQVADSPFTVIAVQGNMPAGARDLTAEDQSLSIYRQLTLRARPAPENVEFLASSASTSSARAVGPSPSKNHSAHPELVEGWVSHLSTASSAVSASGLRTQDSALVIWPETTLRVWLPQQEHFREAVFDVAQTLHQPMLVGSLDGADQDGAEFNSLFVVSPTRALSGVYHKAQLLPFGETAPLIGAGWRTTGRFTHGAPPTLLTVGTHRFAPSICYEALFPGAFNHLVRAGAEFLVNITDDAWFGSGNAPWQHLQGTIFRAVETRRPLVRASNSGISAIVEPSGRISARTQLFTRTIMQGTITPAHGETLYVRWGDWFPLACALVTAGFFVARWR